MQFKYLNLDLCQPLASLYIRLDCFLMLPFYPPISCAAVREEKVTDRSAHRCAASSFTVQSHVSVGGEQTFKLAIGGLNINSSAGQYSNY